MVELAWKYLGDASNRFVNASITYLEGAWVSLHDETGFTALHCTFAARARVSLHVHVETDRIMPVVAR